MRIAFVCGFAWEPKGTVRARAFPLAAELVRRGHTVTIFTVPYDNKTYSSKEWEQEGVTVSNVKLANSPVVNLFRAPCRALLAIYRSRPDLVHVFKPKGFAAVIGEVLRVLQRYPIVLDCDDWEGFGGWNDVVDYPWPVKVFIDYQEKSLTRSKRVGAVTVASRVLLQRCLELGRQPDSLFYVPNCVASTNPLRGTLPSAAIRDRKQALGMSERITMFYAGHFHPADDVQFVCQSLLAVTNATDAAVVFAGDGPELPKVRKFFEGRSTDVRFLGRIPYETYLEYLHACDIGVFPYPDNAVYRAKCSARIVDYMAAGKAVVSTRVGQNPEYIVDGESGVLTAAGDMDAFVRNLIEIVHNEERRARLGRNARSRILNDFVWDGAAVESCLNAYAKSLRKATNVAKDTPVTNALDNRM